uniref:hypothetical protein n=1 Tax=Thaumasiovibrio occultus TaxID=1891184 RepID=UPI000B352F83|nr:hypothetical protein [Thaumasiovibrio occultus]
MKQSQWSCSVCHLPNKGERLHCTHCGSDNDNRRQEYERYKLQLRGLLLFPGIAAASFFGFDVSLDSVGVWFLLALTPYVLYLLRHPIAHLFSIHWSRYVLLGFIGFYSLYTGVAHRMINHEHTIVFDHTLALLLLVPLIFSMLLQHLILVESAKGRTVFDSYFERYIQPQNNSKGKSL